MTGPEFTLRAKFLVDNMQVLEGDNLVTANTFYVRDENKSVELYTHTRDDKEDWLEKICTVWKSIVFFKTDQNPLPLDFGGTESSVPLFFVQTNRYYQNGAGVFEDLVTQC